MTAQKVFKSSIYRLVISNIQGYGEFPITTKNSKRSVGLCPQLDNLKKRVLDHLLLQQNKRKIKLINWSIAWEIHPGSGLPHLDILIIFERNVKPYLNGFDYLIKDLGILQAPSTESFTAGHVWITPYSPTKLNKAILDYGEKQDPSVITNMTDDSKEQLVRLNQLKDDPYAYLYDQMKKNPLHFDLQQYVQKHNLSKHISTWSSIKVKLKDMQVAAANLLLKSSPGFAPITRSLIRDKLTLKQLELYDSWKGYSTIVSYLNQMITHKGKRPLKTLNLLITGAPNTGKTTLFHNPHHPPNQACVQDYCSVFPMGMSQWFPKYSSGVYDCIFWNQMKLTSYSYDTILKLLEGSHMDLPNKGSVSRKVDNPLVVMTSNMSLEQMIRHKFPNDARFQVMARSNLAVRIQNVIIPPGYDLFLLQKLLVPKSPI